MEAQLDGARVLVEHRSAVDSAISLLSAGIMRSWATDHAFAPWCDHAASVLRTCLRASAPSTPDEDVPGAVTAALLDLAAVRTGFPLSHYEVWSTATTRSMAGAAFAATAGEPEDWYRVSAEHLGCSAEAEALLREGRSLWAAFPGPASPLDVPERAWTTTSDVSGCPICDPARA